MHLCVPNCSSRQTPFFGNLANLESRFWQPCQAGRTAQQSIHPSIHTLSTMTSSASPTLNDGVTLAIPTPDDFAALAVTKDLAFAEKRGCWATSEANQRTIRQAYETYVQKHPNKLEHCRIVRGSDPATGDVIIMAACQLQMPGDPGDLCFSDPSWRHELLDNGEAYVEFIATHPNYTGRGLGSKLLAWAFQYCQQYDSSSSTNQQPITRLTLDVMTRNKGAIRLYERKGFVSQRCNPHDDICDVIFTPCCLFVGMGCQYCSITYMEKPIVARSDHAGRGAQSMAMDRGGEEEKK